MACTSARGSRMAHGLTCRIVPEVAQLLRVALQVVQLTSILPLLHREPVRAYVCVQGAQAYPLCQAVITVRAFFLDQQFGMPVGACPSSAGNNE